MKRASSFILYLVIVTTLFSCSTEVDNTQKNINIRLAMPIDPVGWLTYIALEKGFTKKHGLIVDVIKRPSGKRALEAMLNNEADYCITSEVPLAFSTFNSDTFSILATIGSADNEVKIVARKDHGISKPDDLAGKTLSTQQNSAIHFFLDLFLTKNKLIDKTTIKFHKIEHLATELNKGTIDAISTREPFITQLKNSSNDNIIIFSESDLYRKSFHLLGQTKVINQQPEVAFRLLKAHIEAQKWIADNPVKTSLFISSKLDLDKTYVSNYISTADFSVRLNQSLIHTLEDVGTWAINNKFISSDKLPNYINIIKPEYLKKIKPISVNFVY